MIDPRRRRPLVASALSCLLLTGAAAAVSQPAASPQNELARLADALKAAVASGAMDEDEASRVYFTMVERLGVGEDKDDAADEGDAGAGKRDVTLPAPSPREIRVLFRPDFLTRDVAMLQRRLSLDPDQIAIVTALLEDYAEAFDVASSPLRDGLERYQRSTTDEWLISAFERVELPEPEIAAASIRKTADAWAGATKAGADRTPPSDAERAARTARSEELARRMLKAADSMEERLAELRDRVASELAEMNQAGVSAEDLVRIARQLRADRMTLRTELVELFELVTTERQRGDADTAFLATVAWLEIERLRPLGRLSGEAMDLRAALAEALNEAGAMPEALGALDARSGTIAAALAARTEATLDREIAGLGFEAARDRITRGAEGLLDERAQARIQTASRPFTNAVERELSASIAARDTLLDAVNGLGPVVADEDLASAVAGLYRDAALRRGFPAEMRIRWAERALVATVALPDLGDDVRRSLGEFRLSLAGELRALRTAAVARRIEREPVVARAQIGPDARDRDSKDAFGAELWLGMDHEAFVSLDDVVETQLRGMLTPDQFAVLPPRRAGSPPAKDAGPKSAGTPAGLSKPSAKEAGKKD